jgi:aspartate/methionine/tyrosine aminotransferase
MDLPPFDPLNVRAAELRAAGHDVITLGQALPFFPPPDSAIAAARAAIDRRTSTCTPPIPGCRACGRRSPLAWLSRRDSVSRASDLLISAGANHAFTLVLTTVVSPGDEVILPAPWFTNHQMAVVALGATPVDAPIGDRKGFEVRWADIAPHVSAKTRAVVLCNPSNPTGAPVSAADGEEIVREAAALGIAVISDETYRAFVYEGTHWSAASAPGWRDNVIVVGSFSKAFGMMGWRVGYVLADAGICEQVVKVQDAMIICAPVISQIAAEAAVRESWDYPFSFHAELRRRRQALAGALDAIPGLHWTPTRGALFALVRVDGCARLGRARPRPPRTNARRDHSRIRLRPVG